MTAESNRRSQHVQNALGGRSRSFQIDGSIEEYNELVATKPCHRVAGPNCFPDPTRHNLQSPVASLVTERVIDGLEPIEIDEQHGDTISTISPIRLAALLATPKAKIEIRPIRQTCEAVMKGLVGKPLLKPADLGMRFGLSQHCSGLSCEELQRSEQIVRHDLGDEQDSTNIS